MGQCSCGNCNSKVSSTARLKLKKLTWKKLFIVILEEVAEIKKNVRIITAMIAAHCVGSTAVLELLQVSADCSRLLMAIDG